MAQRSDRPGPVRIRPISVAILVVCLLLIVAILAAWRGSSQMYGRIPEVRFSTDTWTVSAEPVYWDTPTDHGGEGTQYIRPLSERQFVTVMLPGELHRAPLTVFATRLPVEGPATTDVRTFAPGEAKTLGFPAVTDAGYLAEIVVSSGAAPVYDADGEDSVLAGKWSLQVREVPKEGTRRLEGLPPVEPLPDRQTIEIPESGTEGTAGSGANNGGGDVPNPHGSTPPRVVNPHA